MKQSTQNIRVYCTYTTVSILASLTGLLQRCTTLYRKQRVANKTAKSSQNTATPLASVVYHANSTRNGSESFSIGNSWEYHANETSIT